MNMPAAIINVKGDYQQGNPTKTHKYRKKNTAMKMSALTAARATGAKYFEQEYISYKSTKTAKNNVVKQVTKLDNIQCDILFRYFYIILFLL